MDRAILNTPDCKNMNASGTALSFKMANSSFQVIVSRGAEINR